MNHRCRAVILAFCGFTITNAAFAADEVTDHVRAIAADQTITLDVAGTAMFADIVFPDSERAEAWLATHLLQKNITYKPVGDDAADRYGRLLIKSDIEEAMLRDGAAVLFSIGHPLKSWQDAEDEARTARRGIWDEPGFMLTPETAAPHMQEFHVIEGTITGIHEGKHATYINFGSDWHTDFSVTIPGRAKRSLAKTLEGLGGGAHVQVRGVIYEENGPMIRITRPEQLEIL